MWFIWPVQMKDPTLLLLKSAGPPVMISRDQDQPCAEGRPHKTSKQQQPVGFTWLTAITVLEKENLGSHYMLRAGIQKLPSPSSCEGGWGSFLITQGPFCFLCPCSQQTILSQKRRVLLLQWKVCGSSLHEKTRHCWSWPTSHLLSEIKS